MPKIKKDVLVDSVRVDHDIFTGRYTVVVFDRAGREYHVKTYHYLATAVATALRIDELGYTEIG